MRIPSILPRRTVETSNFSYVPDAEVTRQLQAENERLRMQLLGACFANAVCFAWFGGRCRGHRCLCDYFR